MQAGPQSQWQSSHSKVIIMLYSPRVSAGQRAALLFCSSVESASFEDVEELVAEFRVLHRIGPHHHIVSLLGAVICNGETVRCEVLGVVRCGVS